MTLSAVSVLLYFASLAGTANCPEYYDYLAGIAQGRLPVWSNVNTTRRTIQSYRERWWRSHITTKNIHKIGRVPSTEPWLFLDGAEMPNAERPDSIRLHFEYLDVAAKDLFWRLSADVVTERSFDSTIKTITLNWREVEPVIWGLEHDVTPEQAAMMKPGRVFVDVPIPADVPPGEYQVIFKTDLAEIKFAGRVELGNHEYAHEMVELDWFVFTGLPGFTEKSMKRQVERLGVSITETYISSAIDYSKEFGPHSEGELIPSNQNSSAEDVPFSQGRSPIIYYSGQIRRSDLGKNERALRELIKFQIAR